MILFKEVLNIKDNKVEWLNLFKTSSVNKELNSTIKIYINLF